MPDSSIFRCVLLTGATGFLGSAVARALLDAGHGVRALVRAETPRHVLDGLPIDYAPGDLLDPASVTAAMRGADAVVHCAADYRLWVPDPARMAAVNVTGTETLMRAALAAGVKRAVHVSSVATLKPRPDGTPADETDAARPEEAIGPYKRTKVEAERAVERLVAEQGLPAVIANPSTPIGPRDVRPTPTGRVLLDAARGKVPGYVDTGLNLVHADDCARGIVAALERGRIGERYILGGQDVTLRELLLETGRLAGRSARPVPLPRGPLYPLALGMEGWARLTGKEPLLTRDALRMSRYRMFFSSAKAARELGHAARPWEEAVADALDWFRLRGMLPA
ncbi:hopanoid-associated sugar epimerase [Roseomonas sp. BN140053]|uniref:hopanoid-associated sugar epimerase n=1 Tax=Roseomonas sp. BN140053 TaxID=3391898 RepID=UPI0039EC2B14